MTANNDSFTLACDAPTTPVPVMGVGSTALLGWIAEKVAQAEKTLAARESLAAVCRSGTQKEWTAAAKSTGTRASTKAERLKEADIHDRIAVKLRRELDMFRATHAALSALPNV